MFRGSNQDVQELKNQLRWVEKLDFKWISVEFGTYSILSNRNIFLEKLLENLHFEEINDKYNIMGLKQELQTLTGEIRESQLLYFTISNPT